MGLFEEFFDGVLVGAEPFDKESLLVKKRSTSSFFLARKYLRVPT